MLSKVFLHKNCFLERGKCSIKSNNLIFRIPPQTEFRLTHDNVNQEKEVQPEEKKKTAWQKRLEQFDKRKAEYIVQYGSTFFVIHELLGISSYLITYGLLSTNIIPLASIVDFLGWKEEDLKARGLDLNSKLVTFAMTVVIVKGLDVMGLVPLRWAMTFMITPRVARYIGPYVDSLFGALRRLKGRIFAKK